MPEGRQEIFLSMRNICKDYNGTRVIDDLSLDIEEGEFVVLLGPSGCGKTTTLRMLAGFVGVASGNIILDGEDIQHLPPYRREMGLVFQSYALFPHMTVAENIAFGLQMRRQPREAIASRVAELLDLVKLAGYEARLPRQLSGGQQQRVALARAIAIDPKVLLLDEPLSNLDASLRQQVAHEIRLLQKARGLTTIMVTHDQLEAMSMADRLVVMRNGRIEQAGTQRDLYERPASSFVASFIGGSNIVEGDLDGAMFRAVEAEPVRLASTYAPQPACRLALRPERIVMAPSAGHAGGPGVTGTIELATYLGATSEYLVRIGPDRRLVVRSSVGADHRAGERVFLRWSAQDERVFDSQDRVVAPAVKAASAQLAVSTGRS